MANEVGRPAYTEEQYEEWLKMMQPFLENSNSLYFAIKRAGLIGHKSTIFLKYKLRDWFSEKIDDLRREPGEHVNDAIVTQIRLIADKVKRGEHLSSEENKLQMFFAERSRSAQPFFVNRQETAPGKPIEELLNELDMEGDTVNDVATEAAKQVVEAKPPVQNQE